MTNTFKNILLAAMLLLGGSQVGYAQDLDKGLEAFLRKDYAAALKEWRPLAEQGDVKAQNRLSGMYYYGWGVTKDIVYAHMWLNIAASNGNERAAEFRDDIAENELTPSQLEEAQRLAREWFEKYTNGVK